MALFLSIAALLVAGIAGAQYRRCQHPAESPAGSEPGSGGGGNGVAGICVAPTAPDDASVSESGRSDGCNDTIDNPVVDRSRRLRREGERHRARCDRQLHPCPGDDDPVVTDPYQGAQRVEPTPGMSDLYPHAFDKAVVDDDGKTLTIFFWSGVEPCYVLDHVDVDYGPGAITVTLFEGHDASAGDVACIEIALLKKVVVQLDEPVGDRRVVDGAA